MLTAEEIELAMYAVTEIGNYATQFQNKVTAGTATRADLDAAFAKLDTTYDGMVEARRLQKIREQEATAINAAGDTTGKKVPDGG